jgi:hypothetical protein
MEITNFSYFNTDNKCYQPKQELNTEKDLNAYVANNFDVYNYEIKKSSASVSNVDLCKKKALAENKSLFLVGNASVDAATQSATYDCLIPKRDKIYTTGNINNLLKPFNDLINDLFGNNQLFRNTGTATTIEFDSAERRSTDINLPSCFSIDQDNIKDTFSKSGRFVIYKTELVDNSNIDRLGSSQSYEFYKNDFNSISQNTDGILERFKLMFKSAICEGSTAHQNNLDTSIVDLKNHYGLYFASLDNISTDLSNLSVITNYETLYLEKLQRDIDAKKKQLKNLIGFDGANNGKLSDTEFLKNLKISENILLFFVLILVIYAYRRKLI